MSDQNTTMSNRAPRWPWLFLALAAGWSVLIRAPLILNSANHLDSDLAVDGLTLLEATKGHFAWHYPGTPYMGAATVGLSLPQALIWGANPATLVSGGTVAYLGLILAVFLLAWRAFGPVAAVFSLVPLAFASNGAVWLSGRITGGHLAAAVFHAGLFLGFAAMLKSSNRTSKGALLLGLWSGFGLYVDSMFMLSLLGFSTAAVLVWLTSCGKRHGLILAIVYALGFVVGVAPREIGARLDPYSAYGSQFDLVTDKNVLMEHARLLVGDCLPRLFSGHRLPGLETDPDPKTLSGPGTSRSRSQIEPLGIAVSLVALSLALASFGALVVQLLKSQGSESGGTGPVLRPRDDRQARNARGQSTGPVTPEYIEAERQVDSRPLHPTSEWPVALGLLVSTLATLAAFVTNRNIFNSDNYRYLVTLLVPAALGFGLLMRGLWSWRWKGRVFAVAVSTIFALLMTADLARWYHQFGWVTDRGMPVRVAVDDPTLAWLEGHPEFNRITGDYWDVYRLIFLGGGRLKGSPYPIYPDRFPSWKKQPGEREAMIARPSPEAKIFVDRALAAGGKMIHQRRGIAILNVP